MVLDRAHLIACLVVLVWLVERVEVEAVARRVRPISHLQGVESPIPSTPDLESGKESEMEVEIEIESGRGNHSYLDLIFQLRTSSHA